MFKLALALAGLLAGLALAVSAATANQGVANAKCKPWAGAGAEWRCADPVGDVTGAGPDIARVEWGEWGIQFFRVTFTERPPLAHSATFTDKVSVYLTTGKTRYVLTVSCRKPGRVREVLRRLPNGKPVILAGKPLPGVVFPGGKAVTLSYDNRQLDRAVTGWRVKVARVMLNGTPGGSDFAPDTGWYR